VNKCGLFLKFSPVEKICFQHGNHQSYFLLSFACYIVLYLRFITAKSEIFNFFTKSSVNFFSYYFFEQRAFKHIFVFMLMQMWSCLKWHMRVDFVLGSFWSLILVVRNNKSSSGSDGKTSDCLSINCLYYHTIILSYVSARDCSLNRLNFLLFFHWFPYGNSAACKKLPD